MYTVALTDLLTGAGILLCAGICIGVWAEYIGHALHHDNHNKRGQR
jgi:hypothetical protein